jgi:hypothetical protein
MRGSILVNGNIQAESEFVYTARKALTSSRHLDPAIRESRKVVLVTAGWLEREYKEKHIKDALLEIGIPSRLEAGYEQNLQNLSLFHLYQDFLERHPALAEACRGQEQLLESARMIYLEKNVFYTALLRRALARLREYRPSQSLGQILTGAPSSSTGRGRVADFLAREIQETILRLVENDDGMVALLRDLDEQFVHETGLHHDAHWMRTRADLTERILASNSIFLFGGHLPVLHRCLSFFRLGSAMIEALRRGTSYYTVSAGSLVCCERVIVYNDFDSAFGEKREFQLFDRGFGLVRQLQIFPHCDDRIQTDDPDNLTYLAQRFRNRLCVGLNEQSFLELEQGQHLRGVSIGAGDGVYVFDATGRKLRYDQGQELPLPG